MICGDCWVMFLVGYFLGILFKDLLAVVRAWLTREE